MSNELIVNPELIYRIARDRMLDLAPGLSALPAHDIVVEPEHYLDYLSHPVSLQGIRTTDNGEQLLVVGTVPADTSATIRLPISQPGVRYQLFKKSGEAVGAAQDGDCGPLVFETEILPKEWHEFYLEATKLNTAAPVPGDRRLLVEVWINAGHDDGVDPTPILQILHYGEGYDLLIPDAPPNVAFTLHNRADAMPYPTQESGKKGGLVTFHIPVMYENDTWRISTHQLLTGKEFGLMQLPMVYVYPNPHLPVMWLDQTPVPYLGHANLVIMDTQASCTYTIQLMGGDPLQNLPAIPGNGGSLQLQSIALEDDCYLQVYATKVEGNLSLYLDAETFIPVYPNPTLQFRLTEEQIPYATGTRLIFDTPQHGVGYAIENEHDIKIGSGFAPVPRGQNLEWDLGPFTEDLIVQMRAFRHGVNSLMYLRIPLFVGPNLQLQVSFAEAPFQPYQGSLVYVDQTQESAEYRLYKVPGDADTWGEPIYCTTVAGNGDRIALATGQLEAFRYQFYVEARKRNSGMEGRLVQELEIELMVRPEIAAAIAPTTVDYHGQVEVQVILPQRFTVYRLVDASGNHLSDLTPYEDGAQAYFLATNPLPEDLDLHIEGENIYTAHRAHLLTHAQIWVYPNPNLDLFLEADVIPYGNLGEIRIHNAQASVEYHIIASPLFPFAYYVPIDPVDYAARPTADGEFLIGFGPLTYPVSGRMIAYKPSSGLSLSLDLPQLPFTIRTLPNHTLVPDIVDNDIHYQDYGVVVVSPTEPLTYYEVRDAHGNALGPRGFNERGSSVVLDCGPFEEDTDLYIWAFCELTQLQAVTTGASRIFVRPNLNFQVSLQTPTFNPSQGLTVAVTPTQESTDYKLFLIEGDQYSWMPTHRAGSSAPGNGGTIYLASGPLDGLRYLLYVHAQKRESSLFGRSLSTVTVYADIRTDCPVSLDDYRVSYGYSLEMQIEYAQPNARYEVFSAQGLLLGSTVNHVEDALLTLTLAPIVSDGPLDIRVTNLFTMQVRSLNAHPVVEVGPRTDLTPFLSPNVVTWQGAGQIVIPMAESNVRYMAIIVGSNDPGWPNGTPLNAIYAQGTHLPSNGQAITYGNAMYDVDLRIRALKTNGLDGWLSPILSLKVIPNFTLKVRALTPQIQSGQSATISIENPQPGVCYELRQETTDMSLSGRFYAAPLAGSQSYATAYGATYVPNSTSVLRINTYPMQMSMFIKVVAFKMTNNFVLYLNDKVHITVY